MRIWFTADWHIGHRNVINFCDRPFANLEHMAADLIRRHNEVVEDGDIVFNLGDFSFVGLKKTDDVLRQLKGQQVLVRGNHDERKVFEKARWAMHTGFLRWQLPRTGWELIGSHYPPGNRFGAARRVNVHGHLHGKFRGPIPVLDVGVDANNFYPVSLDEIEDMIEDRERQTNKLAQLMEEN